MIVSFDLDDTLFVSDDKFEIEPKLQFPLNLFYKETLRKGTVELIKKLRGDKVSVWVYTTSYRSEKYISRLFRCYGIKFDNIINGQRHYNEIQAGKSEPMPSKYPGKYRIDLHIDDDKSVAENGKVYGYKVFLIGEQDELWTEKIIAEIERIRKTKYKE